MNLCVIFSKKLTLVLGPVVCLTLILPQASWGKETAQFFQGHWSCEDSEHKQKFVWEAKSVMDGPWIAGQTTAQGSVQSMDFWKVNAQGQPILRKVFLNDGGLVEVQSRGWRKNILKSTGTLKTLKSSFQIRETIKKIDEKTFESSWEKKAVISDSVKKDEKTPEKDIEKNTNKWEKQSTEVCRKK